MGKEQLLKVLWEGEPFGPTGYNEVTRGFVCGLQDLGVQVQLTPWRGQKQTRLDSKVFEKLQVAIANQVDLRGTVHMYHRYIYEDRQLKMAEAEFNAIYTLFETDGIPPVWVPKLNELDRIFVPNKFNKDSFTRSGVDSAKIRIVPHGIDINRFRPGLKPIRISNKRGWTFLFNSEWSPRKSPLELVNAYWQTFGPSENVCLIIKTHPILQPTDDAIRKSLKKLKGSLAPSKLPPVLFCADVWSADLIPHLYAAVDCLVMPTHGEGVGLPIMESMACGLPVVATDWSGCSDFMRPEHSLPIPVKKTVPVHNMEQLMISPFYLGQSWAEIDWSEVGRQMLWAYRNQKEAKQKGIKAAHFIRENYTWEMACKKMTKHLFELVGDKLDQSIHKGPAAPATRKTVSQMLAERGKPLAVIEDREGKENAAAHFVGAGDVHPPPPPPKKRATKKRKAKEGK